MSFEKLLVFTDLHIVPEGERIIGIDPAERLSEAIKHAVALHPDATRAVLTGDLTHHGTLDEYTRLKSLIGDLPVPVHMTLGNHDRRDAFFQVFPETARQGDFACEVVPLADAALV